MHALKATYRQTTRRLNAILARRVVPRLVQLSRQRAQVHSETERFAAV